MMPKTPGQCKLISVLTLGGRKPDAVFQKQNNTFAKRHHIRLWRQPATFGGRPIWVGAATHDIGIRAESGGTRWCLRIDPRIDRERSKVATGLSFARLVTGLALAGRQEIPRILRNATGDLLETDGWFLVLELAGPPQDVAAAGMPELPADVAAAGGD
jgi:hypothetical protein